jgi:NAD(P)-dependent dehydrogenase (short-subunit alcohol dehydrogenase family)
VSGIEWGEVLARTRGTPVHDYFALFDAQCVSAGKTDRGMFCACEEADIAVRYSGAILQGPYATMSHRLKDKVCVITGTGGSIGRAAAHLFAREGAKVVGCDISAEWAELTVEGVRASGGDMVSLHPANMARAEDAAAVIELAIATYGRLDVLYNNCGACRIDWVPDMSYEDFRATLDNEVDVVFHPTKAAWAHLVRAGGGSIINTASVSGKRAYQVLPGLAHMAAKGAVLALTKQLAMEGGPHQIRANSISPGLVRTNQTREFIEKHPDWWAVMKGKLMLGRAGEPEDVAPCAVFLASDESRWITGADFAIDGGTTAW